jgi:hypothetical protein
MQKWEYIRAFFKRDNEQHLRLFSTNGIDLKNYPETESPSEVMTKLGEQGWEYINEIPYSTNIASSSFIIHKQSENFKYEYEGNEYLLNDYINVLGQNGWEFVEVWQPDRQKDQMEFYFKRNYTKIYTLVLIFKRPIEG